MSLFQVYARVLSLLGPEKRLAWFLAGGNVALAAAQFAEPILFGRIIDALSRSQVAGGAPTWSGLMPLLAGMKSEIGAPCASSRSVQVPATGGER